MRVRARVDFENTPLSDCSVVRNARARARAAFSAEIFEKTQPNLMSSKLDRTLHPPRRSSETEQNQTGISARTSVFGVCVCVYLPSPRFAVSNRL